jgi:hypothetical protein
MMHPDFRGLTPGLPQDSTGVESGNENYRGGVSGQAPGKCVYVKSVPWVRIPPRPYKKKLESPRCLVARCPCLLALHVLQSRHPRPHLRHLGLQLRIGILPQRDEGEIVTQRFFAITLRLIQLSETLVHPSGVRRAD